ncbi:MAG TPA: hypothetical protein VKE42_01725, partial [Candidatus Cybelea sp.]|nr:hypothetical protein [Candidatus Cybelea sp.]
MNIDRPALDEAVARGIVTHQQAHGLWEFLAARDRDTPRFRFAHVLYYLGGMVAIGAMSLFITMGWERYGGGGILTISVVYFV